MQFNVAIESWSVYIYSATCLVSTLVSTYSWLVSTPHSVPSSCTLCQTVLIASTSDRKYRFGVPFKVVTRQVGLYIPAISIVTVANCPESSRTFTDFSTGNMSCTDWTCPGLHTIHHKSELEHRIQGAESECLLYYYFQIVFTM